ncbi:hypothetical protein FRB90_001665 [Tulasnella sp. 427]|nr:hypothetical protein FRB90_001665 [Tulasnella sp. 427]
MLRVASKPLTRYSTISRTSAHLSRLRLYSTDASSPVLDAPKPEDVPEPGPSNVTEPDSIDRALANEPVKKAAKKKNLNIQERIASGSSFTQIQMESASAEPTVDDLLALKPARLPDPSRFDYPERYKKIYDKTSRTINRSFTEDQIHLFLRELDPKVQSTPRTKRAAIAFLLGTHWGMPTPKGLSAKDKKPVTEEIILNPERLVILLGKNGEGLRALATQFKVKVRPLPKKFGIEVTGRPDQVSAVRSRLNQTRRKIAKRSIDLPLPKTVRPELYQEISKRSGAYVQPDGDGKVSISADSIAKHESAARLIYRACFDDIDGKQAPLLIESNFGDSSPTSEPNSSADSYAAFPFLPSQTLPWNAGHSVSRVRKVGGLLRGIDQKTAASDIETFFGDNVKSGLFDNLSSLPQGYIRRIEARTGHVLTSIRQNQSLLQASEAHVDPSSCFKSVLDGRSRTFVYSTSPTEIGSGNPQRKYRLVYQCGLSPTDGEGIPSKPTIRSQLIVDFVQVGGGRPPVVECRSGSFSRVDLACPDRALDISFTAFDHKVVLIDEIPQLIKKFARRLPESFSKVDEILLPDGLSSITFNGSSFYLQSSHLVELHRSTLQSSSGASKGAIEVLTDLDSKTTTTTTVCMGSDTDAGWKKFMQQCGEAVAQPFYRPQANFVPYRPTLIDG